MARDGFKRSEYSPSTFTIRVRIPLKPAVFLQTCFKRIITNYLLRLSGTIKQVLLILARLVIAAAFFIIIAVRESAEMVTRQFMRWWRARERSANKNLIAFEASTSSHQFTAPKFWIEVRKTFFIESEAGAEGATRVNASFSTKNSSLSKTSR